MGRTVIKKKQYGIRLGGKLYRESFASATEARAWQRKMRLEYEKEVSGTALKFKPRKIEEAMAEFLRNRMHKESWRHDASRINSYVLPTFPGREVHSIDTEEWKKLLGDGDDNREGLLCTKYGLSRTTSNLVRTLIRKFYEDARKIQKCALTNPIADIKKLEEEEVEIPFLASADQMDAYIQAARTLKHPGWYILTMIDLNTGARWGNIIPLTWDDIDFENRKINFRRKFSHLTRTFVKGTKGSINSHSVAINDALFSVLSEWKAKTPFAGSDDYVVCRNDGKPFSLKLIQTQHREALIKAGLWDGSYVENEKGEMVPSKGYFKPHALRHTYATHYLKAGGNIYALKEILNHSSVTVTERYLRNIEEDKLRKAQVFQVGARLDAEVISLQNKK